MSARQQCSFRECDFDAAWAAPDHVAEAAGSPEFMCEYHFAEYSRFKTNRTPGLDPPSGASDFWQPSLLEMIRHAGMEARRQERVAPPPVLRHASLDDTARFKNLTPAQQAQALFLRRRLRELRDEAGA